MPVAKPRSSYYAVNDRPVKIVELPGGGGDALAFDWSTGGFVSDRSCFARTIEPGKDVDQLTEEQFRALVHALRGPISARRRTTPLVWEHTGDGEIPFRTRIGERVLTIRVNDFCATVVLTCAPKGSGLKCTSQQLPP